MGGAGDCPVGLGELPARWRICTVVQEICKADVSPGPVEGLKYPARPSPGPASRLKLPARLLQAPANASPVPADDLSGLVSLPPGTYRRGARVPKRCRRGARVLRKPHPHSAQQGIGERTRPPASETPALRPETQEPRLASPNPRSRSLLPPPETLHPRSATERLRVAKRRPKSGTSLPPPASLRLRCPPFRSRSWRCESRL